MAANGLVLIKPSSVAKTGASSTATINAGGSVTFGLCETLSLNDVFSSEYDNYIVDMRWDTSITATSYVFYYRLRASGTDATGSDYTYQRLDANGTTVAGSRSSSQTSGWFGGVGYGAEHGNPMFIYGPALAQPTASRNLGINAFSGGIAMVDCATTHSLSTAYDGITFYPGAGTVTGLVKVYGLVK